jgi:hypothetical protein
MGHQCRLSVRWEGPLYPDRDRNSGAATSDVTGQEATHALQHARQLYDASAPWCRSPRSAPHRGPGARRNDGNNRSWRETDQTDRKDGDAHRHALRLIFVEWPSAADRYNPVQRCLDRRAY